MAERTKNEAAMKTEPGETGAGDWGEEQGPPPLAIFFLSTI